MCVVCVVVVLYVLLASNGRGVGAGGRVQGTQAEGEMVGRLLSVPVTRAAARGWLNVIAHQFGNSLKGVAQGGDDGRIMRVVGLEIVKVGGRARSMG